MVRKDISHYLSISASRHSHLCPRQVLGVQAALAGLDWLGFANPPEEKRLLVIVETDGCFVDGIEAACGVTVGHRTLRIVDFGKIAATFIDTECESAVRLSPQKNIRLRAQECMQSSAQPYDAQLQAYQWMSFDQLFVFQPVRLTESINKIVSQPGLRVTCSQCGEEVINQREIQVDGHPLCLACAGKAYYQPLIECQTLPFPPATH